MKKKLWLEHKVTRKVQSGAGPPYRVTKPSVIKARTSYFLLQNYIGNTSFQHSLGRELKLADELEMFEKGHLSA